MHRWKVCFLMALMVSAVSLAQDDTEAKKTDSTREQRTDESRQERLEALRERVRRAMQLPRTTEEARKEGVPEEEVQEVLKTGRDEGISAGDMQEILENENEELREGREDQFGAAVREMKASGLRGRELAEAIHAEQVARGMKKPKRGHKGHGDDADEAQDDEHGRGGVGRRADPTDDERAESGGDLETQAEEAQEQGKGRGKNKANQKAKGKDKNKGR